VKATERQKRIDELGARIDPNLRDFIDAVIVPILVRDYVAQRANGIHIAKPIRAVPQFQPDAKLSAERIPG
jgi:hypothetical protein